MENTQLSFRNNFIEAFENSGFSSFRSLSHASGTSSSRVQKIATGDFDCSNVGPGIFTIDRMCRQMNVTPNDLLGYEDGGRSRRGGVGLASPDIEKLVARYVTSGGKLDAFLEFSRFLQIYAEPKNNRIHLLTSGPLSLASRAAGTSDVEYLQDQFFHFTKETKKAIYAGQRHAWENGVGLEVLRLNHDMPEKNRRAKFSFLRAAFKLRNNDGTECLAVYCELIV